MARENKVFCAQLRKIGFEVDTQAPTFAHSSSNHCVKISGKLGSAVKFVNDYADFTLTHQSETNNIRTHLTSTDRPIFCGGTPESLKTDIEGSRDMAPFVDAKGRFSNSEISQKLVNKLSKFEPKRTRRFSDQDGEWSYDRRWEIQPFQTTQKTLVNAHCLDLKLHFAISGGTDANDIDAYGAAAWAISDLIEKTGVKTRIILVIQGIKNSQDGKMDCEIELLLKDYGQYLAPSMLAACVTSNFYRRVGFAFYVAASEAASKKVKAGLGYPPIYTSMIDFKNGAVNLYPRMIGKNFATWSSEAETAILEALQVKG